MIRFLLLLSVFFLTFLTGCYKKKDLPIIPVLEFIAMDKDTLLQGFAKEDSIVLYLELIDGDGDIGFENEDTLSKSIFITDLRTGNVSEQFKIPKIPENVSSNGIQAEMELKLYTTCCLFPDNIPPCSVNEAYPIDTISYSIIIVDRAGNTSNTVLTPPIILLCE